MASAIQQDVYLPLTDKLLSKEITPEQFVSEVSTKAQTMLDSWVKKQTEKDKALVELHCNIPDWYPGPHYPNYKPPVSDACKEKLKELGIQ